MSGLAEPTAAPSTDQEQPAMLSPHPVPRPGGRETKREIVLAREIRARGLVNGLAPAQIAAAIHSECAPVAGTTWIRAYRLALGISLTDVVAQVRAWYLREGRAVPRFSETLLSAYESGQKRPGPEYLHYLCTVYRAEPAELGYPGTCLCGWGHREAAQGPPGGPNGLTGAEAAGQPPGTVAAADHQPGALRDPGAERLPAREVADPARPWELAADAESGLTNSHDGHAEDDDGILRSTLLRLIANASVTVDSALFGAVDRIRRRMDEALVSGTVSATMLDQWEETTVGYGKQYMTVPPLRLLCDVLLDFGDVRRMSEHRQPLEFVERLCRLAGRLAGLAGMIMIDVGDPRLARSFFRTARTAADETGDRHLRAWVAVREALVPLYYGDPGEACRLARAGAGLAGRNPCVAGVMAPVIDARSLARSAARRGGDGKRQVLRRVMTMLSQAHQALGRLPGAERGDTAFGYTQRQLLFHEGDTLVTLGHHRGAEQAFTRSLKLYAPDEVLDRSLVTFGLARCRLESDEPEEALRLGWDTLQAVPLEHRSEIVIRAARSLGDSVAGRHGDVPAVRHYREALVSQ